MYWFPNLKRRILFRDCSIKECGFFWITNWDGEYSLSEKKEFPIIKRMN
jgi:hypothetical protein